MINESVRVSNVEQIPGRLVENLQELALTRMLQTRYSDAI